MSIDIANMHLEDDGQPRTEPDPHTHTYTQAKPKSKKQTRGMITHTSQNMLSLRRLIRTMQHHHLLNTPYNLIVLRHTQVVEFIAATHWHWFIKADAQQTHTRSRSFEQNKSSAYYPHWLQNLAKNSRKGSRKNTTCGNLHHHCAYHQAAGA